MSWRKSIRNGIYSMSFVTKTNTGLWSLFLFYDEEYVNEILFVLE